MWTWKKKNKRQQRKTTPTNQTKKDDNKITTHYNGSLSLPWCHLKRTNKSPKFETLMPFLFCTSMWKDFHQNVPYWKHIWQSTGKYIILRHTWALFSPNILQAGVVGWGWGWGFLSGGPIPGNNIMARFQKKKWSKQSSSLSAQSLHHPGFHSHCVNAHTHNVKRKLKQRLTGYHAVKPTLAHMVRKMALADWAGG